MEHSVIVYHELISSLAHFLTFTFFFFFDFGMLRIVTRLLDANIQTIPHFLRSLPAHLLIREEMCPSVRFLLCLMASCRLVSGLATESRSSRPAPAPSAAALVPTSAGPAGSPPCRRGLWDCSVQPSASTALLDSTASSSFPRITPGKSCAISGALCRRA